MTNKRLTELLASLTEGTEGGPWHAVTEYADRRDQRWWLENAAGDSSFPTADDMALLLNALPALLAGMDVRPDSNVERAALKSGTHTPAVDDFGNQYLDRVREDQIVVMAPDHWDDDCSGPCCA